ncbi:hypothetical protein OF83DRAFT_1021400, partial [Amylostereum chailletii]
ELEHGYSKKNFALTNKNQWLKQLAKIETRQRFMHGATDPLGEEPNARRKRKMATDDSLPHTPPAQHYHISNSRRTSSFISDFLDDRDADPAFDRDMFIPSLKDHMLTRIHDCAFDGDELQYSPEARVRVHTRNDKFYHHRTFRINYTSYDVR